MNKSVKQYLKKINKQIHCPSSMKRTFLCQLEDEIFCFYADHDDVDIVTLSQDFGTPEVVAEEFLSNLSEQTISCCTKTRKRLLYLTLGMTLTAIIFVTILGVRTASLRQKMADEEFIASITYEKEPDDDTFWLPFWHMIFGGEEKVINP